MKKMKRELERIDKLIKDFKAFHKRFPQAGFEKTVHMLEDERAKITSRIGNDSAR